MIATARMTAAEFDALPSSVGRHLELWEGEIVEVSRANARHQKIVLRLSASLLRYLDRKNTGDVYPDVEFAMGPNLRLAPDIAVLLGDKWRTMNPETNPIPFSPDIAIEVISPSERTADGIRKIQIYLQKGVSEVWQIFPETEELLIHRTETAPTVLRAADTLTTALFPDWQMRLDELFKFL